MRSRLILSLSLALVLLASRPAAAAFALDTNICPTASTAVSGANASTTVIVVGSSTGFAAGQSVQLTQFNPPTFHSVTATGAGTVTISPAAPSAPTSGNLSAVCLHQHFSVGGVYTGGTATVNFTTAYTCGGAGTVIYYLVVNAEHGNGTTSGAPVVTAGTPANFSTLPTLVVGANAVTSAVASTDGGFSIYRAVCAGTGTDTSKLTATCTGGTNICSTGTAAGVLEATVQMIGFTPTGVFATPGNVGTGHANGTGTPAITLTTSAGDKLFFLWGDFSGANCTQTLIAGSSYLDIFEIPGPLNVGCNAGNDDYYVAQNTTTTTSAGSTSIGVISPTTVAGIWGGLGLCDPTATACPNASGPVAVPSTGARRRRGNGFN